jgi:addiction module RelB/DinJ family antitoxin
MYGRCCLNSEGEPAYAGSSQFFKNFGKVLAICKQIVYNICKEAITMSRTASIYARVKPNVKSEAESILEELGLSMSNAVELFLNQVVIQRGLPFDVKLSPKKPLVMSELTQQEFDSAISKGIEDIDNGRVYSSQEVRERMRNKYGI